MYSLSNFFSVSGLEKVKTEQISEKKENDSETEDSDSDSGSDSQSSSNSDSSEEEQKPPAKKSTMVKKAKETAPKSNLDLLLSLDEDISAPTLNVSSGEMLTPSLGKVTKTKSRDFRILFYVSPRKFIFAEILTSTYLFMWLS